jgi:type III secretion protein T
MGEHTVNTSNGFYDAMLLLALAYARIAPLFYLLPLFSDRVLTGIVLKNTIVIAILVGLLPMLQPPPPISGFAAWMLLGLKEAAVGLVLGVSLALPFWVAGTIGELIDNQRGATMADSIDPASGVEASVTGPFVTLFFTVVFLEEGGMRKIVGVLADSYQYVRLGGVIDGNVMRVAALLTEVVGAGIAFAAPALIAMFLADAVLGLVSRFCPQLNAFAVSTSLKSVVAFFVLLLYLGVAAPPALERLIEAFPLSSLLR